MQEAQLAAIRHNNHKKVRQMQVPIHPVEHQGTAHMQEARPATKH